LATYWFIAQSGKESIPPYLELLLREPCSLELPATYDVTDLDHIRGYTPDQIASLIRENPEQLAVFLLNALKRGQNPPYVNQKSYSCGSRTDIPDCVESTMRNFFNVVLFDGNEYNFDLLPETVRRNVNPKLLEFYRRFPLEETLSDEAGQEWFLLLSSLHEKAPFIRYTSEACELDGDEENVVRVLNALFNTEESFFSDFASLLSTPERQISIEQKRRNEYLLNIEDRNINFSFEKGHAQCKFVTIEDPSLTAIFNSILREQTPLSLVVLTLDPSILFTGHYFDDRNYLSLGRTLSNPNIRVNIIESITKILNAENPDSEKYCSWITSLLNELEKTDDNLYKRGLAALMKEYVSISICAKELIEKRKETSQDLLFVAAKHGSSINFIEHIIARGARVDETSRDGKTALMYAAMTGRTDAVMALLSGGARIDETDMDGNTALMYAAMTGRTDAVMALLSGGARVDETDMGGNAALMYAAMTGHTDAVMALLDRGARVDETDMGGNTALILAAMYGHTDAAIALLDRGARVDETDMYGKTALIFAAMKGHTDAAIALLDRGASVDETDRGGNTALIVAAMYGRTDAVIALLDRGASVDEKNRGGKTALDIAKQSRNSDIVDIITEAIEGAKKAAPTV